MNPVEIPGYPCYFADVEGRIWTSKRKGGNSRIPGQTGALRQLRLGKSTQGYCTVCLDVSGKVKTRAVHQLVLETFVGPKPEGQEGCHYPDHSKANNRLENLRWDTHAENVKDRIRGIPPPSDKRCRRCGIMKPVDAFYRDSRASDGLKTECKPCHLAISISTRDPDKKRKSNREFMRRSRNGGNA